MFYSIQTCRAAAALLVVLFHSAGQLARDRYFGSAAAPFESFFWFGGEAGVAFFFVLSGFIIHHTHHLEFDRPKKLPTYLYKRVIRIYPTYLIVFLTVYWLATFLDASGEARALDSISLIKALLLVPQDPTEVGGTGAPILFVAWSLQYEMVFYLAFAASLVRRWLLFLIIAAYLVNMAGQSILGPYGFPGSFLASHLFLLFGMGMLASIAQKSRVALPRAGLASIGLAAAFLLASVIVTLNRPSHEKWISDLVYGVISAGLIFTLSRYESRKGAVPGRSVARVAGDVSYALYLIHVPIISLLSKLAVLALPITTTGAAVAMIVLVSASAASALAFNLLIERPSLRALSLRRPPSMARAQHA